MTDYSPDITCNCEISTWADISDMGYNFLFQIRTKKVFYFSTYAYMWQLNDYAYQVLFLLVLAVTSDTTIILPANEAFELNTLLTETKTTVIFHPHDWPTQNKNKKTLQYFTRQGMI